MYVFRPGQPTDIPTILQLTAEWASEDLDTTGHPEDNDATDVQGWIGPYFWVAEHDNQVIGFIVGFVDGDSNTGEHDQVLRDDEAHLSLDQLYVQSGHRNHGVGSQLVRHLLAEADAHGLEVVLVHSDNKEWLRTAAFYQRHGFRMWFIKLYRRSERGAREGPPPSR